MSSRFPARKKTSARLNASQYLPEWIVNGFGTQFAFARAETRFPSTPALMTPPANATRREGTRLSAVAANSRAIEPATQALERWWKAHAAVGSTSFTNRSRAASPVAAAARRRSRPDTIDYRAPWTSRARRTSVG